jgi:hypothetical protein
MDEVKKIPDIMGQGKREVCAVLCYMLCDYLYSVMYIYIYIYIYICYVCGAVLSRVYSPLSS